MKYMSGNEIRKMWLDFFKTKGHSIEKGASLIPNDDPTLLWMNAGVAALKKYFDGSVIPKNPRIVNVQKCIRTNDIEFVGKTARHHTFFEMLGNFSIGDYFRKEAVTWGFELLTDEKWFGFDKNLLYMTVYPDDEETKDLWISLGIDPTHVVKTEENNFWEIGEGPCGPCTEIFYDRGEEYGDFGVDAIRDNIENERYIEIWNIVFSQYNAKQGYGRSEYPELPNKNIDTGCGLERITSVIQNAKTNYETDLFMPIIKKIEAISGIDYHGQMAFKVIADHIRTVTFAIADGAILSNEGRGYVLRRLLRRAVKYGKKLGIEKPFMDRLVEIVIKVMKDFYPYINDQLEIIKKIISQEETKFLETLSFGEKRFETIALSSKDKLISGADAFLLYDTFGFPIELTLEYAEEIGYNVDVTGFALKMEKQKNRARNARKDIQSMKSQNEEYIDFLVKSEFVGYETLLQETKIIKVFDKGIVLEKTPFYATSGGQVADTGVVFNEAFSLNVIDVTKLPNGQFLHVVETIEGEVEENAIVIAKVDEQRRKLITYHHSVTHLLFKAMRDLLGPHVSQQGSQVSNESLRFDFNHYEMISDEIILQLEFTVRKMIAKHYETKTEIMTVEEAVKKGAIAEFGEKYEDLVRAVDLKYTLDLCGGTHVKDLHDIGDFAIRALYSIGSGIYRIEGLANTSVNNLKDAFINTDQDIDNIKKKLEILHNSAVSEGIVLSYDLPESESFIGSYQDVINKRNQFTQTQLAAKEFEKEYLRLMQKVKEVDTADFLALAKNNVIIAKAENIEIDQLKQLVDNLMNELKNGFVLVASILENKVLFVAKSSEPSIHAGNMVKLAAVITGGNGGGRPDFAQAGGKDISKVDEALTKVREQVK